MLLCGNALCRSAGILVKNAVFSWASWSLTVFSLALVLAADVFIGTVESALAEARGVFAHFKSLALDIPARRFWPGCIEVVAIGSFY